MTKDTPTTQSPGAKTWNPDTYRVWEPLPEDRIEWLGHPP